MTISPDSIIVQADLKEATDDRKHYAHVVRPPENWMIYNVLLKLDVNEPTAKDIVSWAREHRAFVKALCGYWFIPELDPENYDACQICMDVAGMHMRNEGE